MRGGLGWGLESDLSRVPRLHDDRAVECSDFVVPCLSAGGDLGRGIMSSRLDEYKASGDINRSIAHA